MSKEQLKAYTCAGQYNIYDYLPEHNFAIRQQLKTCSHCGREYDAKTTLHVCRPGDLKRIKAQEPRQEAKHGAAIPCTV